MRRTSLIIFALVMWLATCKAPEPKTSPPVATFTATSTPTDIPPTETPVPPTPTETSVPQGKLPAPPFDAQTYINEEAGFALDIPTAWSIKETVVGPRGTQISFVSRADLAEAATIPAGETRLSATVYQWDPKNDLAAYVDHWKSAWDASAFKILDEQSLTLELGLPAEQFTLQTPDAQTVTLITALKDQYLVISGEGDLELAKQIMERLRPIS